jgi:hypothetical protein
MKIPAQVRHLGHHATRTRVTAIASWEVGHLATRPARMTVQDTAGPCMGPKPRSSADEDICGDHVRPQPTRDMIQSPGRVREGVYCSPPSNRADQRPAADSACVDGRGSLDRCVLSKESSLYTQIYPVPPLSPEPDFPGAPLVAGHSSRRHPCAVSGMRVSFVTAAWHRRVHHEDRRQPLAKLPVRCSLPATAAPKTPTSSPQPPHCWSG